MLMALVLCLSFVSAFQCSETSMIGFDDYVEVSGYGLELVDINDNSALFRVNGVTQIVVVGNTRTVNGLDVTLEAISESVAYVNVDCNDLGLRYAPARQENWVWMLGILVLLLVLTAVLYSLVKEPQFDKKVIIKGLTPKKVKAKKVVKKGVKKKVVKKKAVKKVVKKKK